MASLDMTSAANALKRLYRDSNFRFGTYNRRPMIGILPKDEEFYGKDQPFVIEYANPQGTSATFSHAQSNATSAKIAEMALTRVNMHGVCTIDGETMEAMGNDAGAFVTAMKAQADAQLKSVSNRLESLAPGTGTGALGRCASFSSKALTLLDVTTVHRFEVGMSVVASDGASAEGAALMDSGATEVIAGVSRRTGVLTSTSAAWNTVITSLTASPTSGQEDYLYCEGDAKNGSTTLCTSGFGAWLPATAPTAGDSFFGQDRSTDSRLYGMTHSATGLVKTGLIDGQSVASENGGEVDTGLIHHVKYRQLCKEIDSQTYYTKVPARGTKGKEFAQVSYNGVTINGDHGPITVLAANKMISDVAFLLELAVWKYCSIRTLVRWNTLDSNKLLRQSNDDGVEARFVSRSNIGCKYPGGNCRVTFS